MCVGVVWVRGWMGACVCECFVCDVSFLSPVLCWSFVSCLVDVCVYVGDNVFTLPVLGGCLSLLPMYFFLGYGLISISMA